MIPQIRFKKSSAVATSLRIVILLGLLVFAASPTVSYAAFSGKNGLIVFESTRDGSFGQIYTINPDGTDVTRLTFTAAYDEYPEWSADGNKIVFSSTRDGNLEIYVMNADGSGQTNLTNNSGDDTTPTFSPDGTKIAFTSYRDGNQEIYVMNADGTGQTNLTNNSSFDAQPAWSPDGTKIAFESNRNGFPQIFVMTSDGTNITQLTTISSNGGADWSPDGTKIAYHSNRDCGGCGTYYDIYVMNADGTGQTRLAFDPVYATGPAWSPDGTKITFESQRDGNYEVYMMNADGSGQMNLTNNAGVDFLADWQPQFYNFNGFFQPIDNLPTMNIVKAGKAIPVKFSLGGFQGYDIFAAGYPASTLIVCGVTAEDAIEQTVTAGSSSLSYDASTDQYTYVWKTEKAWEGTCRSLVVKLDDGTNHQVNFNFK